MADDPIPDDVRDYILGNVDSIAQMEALMLLRAQPDDVWDILTISRRLYISEPEVSNALARLIQSGVIVHEHDRFFYRPAGDIRDLVERVMATYRHHLIPVTNLIHSKPSPGRISQFADAFRFRRDN